MPVADLENLGWRQGAIVKAADLQSMQKGLGLDESLDGLIGIVASQSCDIANIREVFVEVSLAKYIESINGNFSYGNNPRKLQLETLVQGEIDGLPDSRCIEIEAHRKVKIPKTIFGDYLPCEDEKLAAGVAYYYVQWLAARYSRPALPTVFNDRIREADKKDKLKVKAKKISKDFSGIYVQIIPDKEISDEEDYKVNLLGVSSQTSTESHQQLNENLATFKKVMSDAGMDVTARVLSENEVSLAMIKEFKRFYYDDISFKNSNDLPVEVTNNL